MIGSWVPPKTKESLIPYTESVLKELHAILVQRGGSYADIEDNSKVFTHMLEDLGVQIPLNMDATMFHCISMIMTKFARASTGNPYHRDTWADIAGYAILILATIDRSAITERKGPISERDMV